MFWSAPALLLVVGIAALLAATIAGEAVFGAVMLGVSVLFATGVVLASRRSETLRGLLDRRDERLRAIDLRASASAGLAVVVAIIIGSLVEFARGHSGAPYTWLSVIAALAYLGTVLVERARH